MISKTAVDVAKDASAWKTATMRGYIKKTVLDPETYGEKAYKLTFVKADGSEYDFYFDNGTGKSSTTLILDSELLTHILNTVWQSADVATYEQVRGGTGTW